MKRAGRVQMEVEHETQGRTIFNWRRKVSEVWYKTLGMIIINSFSTMIYRYIVSGFA